MGKQLAEILTKLNIKWERGRRIIFQNCRRYSPDFYLPDYNIYIEVKGWFRELDKYKMFLVLKENNIDLRMILNLETIEKLNNKKLSVDELIKFNSIIKSEQNIDFTKFINHWK